MECFPSLNQSFLRLFRGKRTKGLPPCCLGSGISPVLILGSQNCCLSQELKETRCRVGSGPEKTSRPILPKEMKIVQTYSPQSITKSRFFPITHLFLGHLRSNRCLICGLELQYSPPQSKSPLQLHLELIDSTVDNVIKGESESYVPKSHKKIIQKQRRLRNFRIVRRQRYVENLKPLKLHYFVNGQRTSVTVYNSPPRVFGVL